LQPTVLQQRVARARAILARLREKLLQYPRLRESIKFFIPWEFKVDSDSESVYCDIARLVPLLPNLLDIFLQEPYPDVALAAEPPFASDYPEMRGECISPTKSIWTPISEKPVPQVEPISMYPVKTLKDSKSLWSSESEETLYGGAVNILEEYEMESNKLRYLSFEKSTKAHYKVYLV
jgi:hypothetical protein